MDKTVIVINGKGGCGKDTLCDVAAKEYSVMNVSSITPIKEMAKVIGWVGVKTIEDRKFLSDLKALVSEYNDGANEYLISMAEGFSKNICEVMFIHIREPDMIEHFKETLSQRVPGLRVITLLVNRDEQKYTVYGNRADDEVDNYKYDYIFNNNSGLERAGEEFLEFLNVMKCSESRSIEPPPTYNVGFYEKFDHAINITNKTSKIWNDHYLRIVFPNQNGPECLDVDVYSCIKLPALMPGENLLIAIYMDARGFEGSFDCCCAVVNENRNLVSEENIYPFRVNVSFKKEEII